MLKFHRNNRGRNASLPAAPGRAGLKTGPAGRAACRPVVLLAVVFLAGCAHPPPPQPSAPGRIGQINIITAPVGLNLDRQPGPDGFSVKVYLNNRLNPKTIPIPSGSIEILMFDGTFYGRTNVGPPSRAWNFDAAALQDHLVTSSIGAGYDFLLRWETNRPSERLITVVARYHSPDGEVLTSPASSVTVLEK